MPFQIIRNDITKVAADAIVNTANPKPKYADGTDRAVYTAAGAEQLLEERKKIGEIGVGQAAVTPAFALPAKYIIHTVGPVWIDGSHGEADAVRSCYRESLKLAEELKCGSIAFPLIATGNYGFPKDLALQIALSEFSAYLMTHEMDITLVVFDRSAFELSGRLFEDVGAFIDENYVDEASAKEYVTSEERRRRRFGGIFSIWRRRGSAKNAPAPLPDEDLEDDEPYIGETEGVAFSRRDSEDDGLPVVGNVEDRDFLASHIESNSLQPPDNGMPAFDGISSAGAGYEAGPRPDAASKSDTFFGGQVAASGVKPSMMPPGSLDDLLRTQEETFQEKLFSLIAEKNLSNAEVYKRANLDRKHFSKIQCNREYSPKKKTVLAFAIALHLNLDETQDLLQRAEYALSPGNKVDLIVQYCILNKIYDIIEVNAILFKYQQPVLGA